MSQTQKIETNILVLDLDHPKKQVFLGTDIPDDIRPGMVAFMKSRSDQFAWSHSDMTGIDPEVICHKLNVDPKFKPIQQRRRKIAPERVELLNSKINKLLNMGLGREDMYHEWLADVVVVTKINGKWRDWVDYN